MAKDDSALPSGAVESGEYNCIWKLDGQDVLGTIELAGGKFPRGTAAYTLPACARPFGGAFPASERRDRVTGYIDAVGRTAVLIDVKVSTQWRNRTYLDAAYALVGRGLGGEDTPTFHEVRFQTTGLELLCGFVPLTHTAYPPSLDGTPQWSARSEGGIFREWSDEDASVKLDFASSATIADPYRFRVRFAPWATIKSREALGGRAWFRGWCTDLLTLVSAATGRAETLTHMQFETGQGTVTVFTARVSQTPYYAAQDFRTHVSYRVGGEDGESLLDVLRSVQARRVVRHPLIEGYDPAILDRAQHPRSRVLQLVQWIEAAYGFETRDSWERRVTDHTTKREDLVEALTRARDNGALTTQQLSFAKRALSKKPYASLDEALRAVFDRHPGLDIRRRLGDLPIVQDQLAVDDCDTVESSIREIRNGLSHGSADYDAWKLDALAEVLRQLVRADYLQLLGCAYDPEAIFPLGE
ncbi:hypothetical protein [Mycolicibacter senuensis]|uniref:hypothetical protein n=1 Tax=Mycolicibacter senuensis TaxID=386913 RepID=UPI000DCDC6F8|nr:hypothetical protein [Mycolicibacter senuensis]RAV03741.1 hypothetical protein DQP56_02455 [Mycolicibacter senuensis]